MRENEEIKLFKNMKIYAVCLCAPKVKSIVYMNTKNECLLMSSGRKAISKFIDYGPITMSVCDISNLDLIHY